MTTFNSEKTNIKFNDTLRLIGLTFLLAGGIWRFETRLSDMQSSIESLKKELTYSYTIELMKINNRIDLLENKQHPISYINPIINKVETKENKNSRKQYPQICMISARSPEFQRKRLVNVKQLIS